MTNTIMTAKNGWSDGLIMDFAPDNTSANCLTSALNATLCTFNGNEMSLQNDMGNGRVETAFLPEGYIPVGSCEFGDIIYIVSYNPLINKSQIGCFPSPERNISSEEIGDLQQSLSYTDFLEVDTEGLPTGKLKASSVKKIIFEKGLNPGDKYFIYSPNNQNALSNNANTITDIGNSLHIYGDYPKLLRLHVVAIEDSGKINYLDSTVKWYDKIPEGQDYFMLELATDATTLTPDLDSYRNLVSDAYSIFQSKVSGKLAILAELEKILGFSCTHSVFTNPKLDDDGNETGKFTYKVYLHTSWETEDPDINPSGYVITKSKLIDNTYKIYQDGKIEEETVDITITENDEPIIEYKDIYYRHYKLENTPSYEDYVTQSSFSKVKENFINDYKNGTDSNYIPSRITLLREDNQYIEKFVYNANNKDEKGYYFIDNSGTRIYVYGTDDADTKYLFVLNPESVDLMKYFTDSFIHNYFHVDITKPYYDLDIIQYTTDDNNEVKYYSDLSNLIHLYTICPAMPYGYLEEYSITNSIDFSKVGSGLINLNEWRYYNDGEVSTLTFGLEAYPENGKGISKVELEFFDNLGSTGVLTISNRTSYSGTFTEVLLLDTEDVLKVNGPHPGTVLDIENLNLLLTTPNNPEGTSVTIKDIIELANSDAELGDTDLENLAFLYRNNLLVAKPLENNTVTSETNLFQSDAGILYSNWLYLVKIKVYYQSYNSLGEFDEDSNVDPIIFQRWFWTNNMWNEHYHNILDFSVLLPQVNVAVQGDFKENENFKLSPDTNANFELSGDTEADKFKNSLSYHLYKVTANDINKPNLTLALVPMLSESYNTFSLLNIDITDEESINTLSHLKYTIYEGPASINVDIPNKIYPDNVTYVPNSDLIEPKTDNGLYYDYFKLDFTNNTNNTDNNGIEYISPSGEVLNTEGFFVYNYTAADFFNGSEVQYSIDLNMEGEFYSKIMAGKIESKNIYYPLYVPILLREDLLEKNNLIVSTINESGTTEYKILSFIDFYDISTGIYGGPNLYLGKTNISGLLLVTEEPLLNKSGKDGRNLNYSLNTFINEAPSDIKGSFLPILWLNDRGGNSMRKLNSLFKDSAILSDWRTKWGLVGNDSDRFYKLCDFEATDFNGDGYIVADHENGTSAFIMSLAALGTTNNWKHINCYSRLYCAKSGDIRYVTQRFGKASPINNLHRKNDIGGFESMAEVIASLLSLIYILDAESKEEIKSIATEPLINENYSEIWNKDIVVKTDCSKIEDILSIRTIPLSDYLLSIDQYYDGGIEKMKKENNITFIFNSSSSLIRFEHICQYNIAELLQEFSYNTAITGAYVTPDISGDYQGEYIDNANYTALYLDVQNKKIQTDPNNIVLQPLNPSNIIGNRLSTKNTSIKMTDFIKTGYGGNGFMKVKNNLLVADFETAENMVMRKHSYDNDDDGADFTFASNVGLTQFKI